MRAQAIVCSHTTLFNGGPPLPSTTFAPRSLLRGDCPGLSAGLQADTCIKGARGVAPRRRRCAPNAFGFVQPSCANWWAGMEGKDVEPTKARRSSRTSRDSSRRSTCTSLVHVGSSPPKLLLFCQKCLLGRRANSSGLGLQNLQPCCTCSGLWASTLTARIVKVAVASAPMRGLCCLWRMHGTQVHTCSGGRNDHSPLD
jgi:hypothetical protein